jgi:hypothetical protein
VYQEYFLGAKVGRCLGLATLPPSCEDCLEMCEPQSPGTLRAVQGCNGIAVPFHIYMNSLSIYSRQKPVFLVQITGINYIYGLYPYTFGSRKKIRQKIFKHEKYLCNILGPLL